MCMGRVLRNRKSFMGYSGTLRRGDIAFQDFAAVLYARAAHAPEFVPFPFLAAVQAIKAVVPFLEYLFYQPKQRRIIQIAAVITAKTSPHVIILSSIGGPGGRNPPRLGCKDAQEGLQWSSVCATPTCR